MDSKKGDSEFSDELDEGFEESAEDRRRKKQGHGDLGLDESRDLSVNDSYDGTARNKNSRLQNDKYDEALELSQSQQSPEQSKQQGSLSIKRNDANFTEGPNLSKSQSVSNRHFDEALEISHSENSEESVDTPKRNTPNETKIDLPEKKISAPLSLSVKSDTKGPHNSMPAMSKVPTSIPKSKGGDDDSSDEEDEEKEESTYDVIDGQYNPDDYLHLSVSAEVKDLFQYITRFKPQEVDLDTALKCFVPEYIPAIGEMDSFLKVPRPDNQPDYLGLKTLDEPASSQSDPTVLELQLRAVTKKQQYGDVVVRSIENASKNPVSIEKWINSISDLHRSKPPPQVHYKRNMPDVETLMEVWPTEFEDILRNTALPSPDLDLTLHEYAKVLCSILDIPMYDNPIESLHLMFTLYMDFKNNPHFQGQNNANFDPMSGGYGDADVMHINQGQFK